MASPITHGYLTFPAGTLTILPRPITVTAGRRNKIYDGTTASVGSPSISSGALAYSDTVTWTESYASRNAGTQTHVNAAGSVNDGNYGNNYLVTFVASSGVISPRPITV